MTQPSPPTTRRLLWPCVSTALLAFIFDIIYTGYIATTSQGLVVPAVILSGLVPCFSRLADHLYIEAGTSDPDEENNAAQKRAALWNRAALTVATAIGYGAGTFCTVTFLGGR